MHRLLLLLAAASLFVTAGCTTARPTTATTLEPKIQAQVEKGIIEPGFTPEMVYLALGKPTSPAEGLVDATTNGTWVYQNFQAKERDPVKAGYRRRVVYDEAKKADVVTTEPIDTQETPNVQSRALYVTFREGRVVEIQRGTEK